MVPQKFVSDFRPGGRGSGCHFRPAAGTRRGVVQECGFIKDFSGTAQSSLGFQWRERESEMSHFARPQKSRRVQEMARLGRPFGFTSWSNEENRDREK